VSKQHLKVILLAFILLFGFSNILPNYSYGDPTGPYRNGFIEGFIKSKGEDKIEIEEYDGTVHILSFAEKVFFVIDTIPASYDAFKPGMEIYATLAGRKIDYMESYSTVFPGYIPEGGKVRNGIIKKIDRNEIILRLPTGKEETYFTSPITITLKNGKNVSLNTLYEGDHVKLFFDDIDSTTISRIEIEGKSIMVKDLYRGVLAAADTLENVITLTQVEVFRNGKWQYYSSAKSIPYSAQIPIYTGGEKVSYNHLRYYRGKTVYMAIKDFFGRDQIEKMVIKNQYESTYSDKIKEINWYSEVLELQNHKNLTFNDGTIIIKNGRLVDKYAINPESDALVVGDGRGSEIMAGVINIYNEDINNSNIGQDYLYEGRLDEIVKDRIILKDFCLLNRNEWESFDEEKELYYDNDINIYDLENDIYITPEEFYTKDYAVDENSDYAKEHGLKDWYAYIYADGDRVSSIILKKKRDSLLSQRVTNGTIEYIENHSLVEWRISLRDAKDWSSRKDAWMAKNAAVMVMLKDAMIVKEGKIISPEQLKAGDRLYMVRDGSHAKVVIVK
jgi:hypothetical protein